MSARQDEPADDLVVELAFAGGTKTSPTSNAGAFRELMRTRVQPLADRVRTRAGQVFAQITGWGIAGSRLKASQWDWLCPLS